ncbi:oocyte zinc finger protein XlCOF7.1-like [Pyxicephalus adspersus]|uniref:oocyte zinc finger protein XlCOF7.1-like n=1 Tax=Pyxicephalus adspersus TaxID=30357 RepID=UPI003B5B011D
MVNSQKMDKERDKMMDRIVNLALEIIYLMTEEDYVIVKKTSCENLTPSSNSPLSGGCNMSKMEPSSLSLKTKRNTKILEITKKIIELLTGEVPIRCQDATVYFSMEEWEYLEGHKDLYKDIILEDHLTRTSPDGSSNRNTPEKCPCPLYSRYSSEEHPQDDQFDDLIAIKVEVKEEVEDELYVMGDDSCREEIPPEICTDGPNKSSNWGRNLDISSEGVLEDDDPKYGSSDDEETTAESFKENSGITLNLHPVFPSADTFSDPSAHGWCFPGNSPIDTHHKIGETFPCSEGRECFTQREDLMLYQGEDQGEKPYSCCKCGKSFTEKKNLISHRRSHTGDKEFFCVECGKCFAQRARLFVHQRTHTGAKPYSCSECGKCFIHRVRLRSHERTHTGMKPFFCSECGKCFAERSNLNAHQSCHAGVKPYSCSVCGKSFHQRRYLISHERTHTGEKPFPCTECGRCFADRSTLARHQRTHSGEKPFPCSVCGKRFTQKSNLLTHEKVHTGEKPYSCSGCGKCFSRKSYLISHEKTHRGAKP